MNCLLWIFYKKLLAIQSKLHFVAYVRSEKNEADPISRGTSDDIEIGKRMAHKESEYVELLLAIPQFVRY